MVKSNVKRTTLDIHGSHHVTQRALAHVCKDIKDRGMPTATSRRAMHRHRRGFANQHTPFGKLIQEKPLKLRTGGCISLPFLHPAAMLWICCRDCPEFKSLFGSVLKGQRLKLVVYTDEIVPGRELPSVRLDVSLSFCHCVHGSRCLTVSLCRNAFRT